MKQKQDSADIVQATSYASETVHFSSEGVEVVGKVMTPKSDARQPAVIVLGPVASVKEQAPIQYATRLAKEGFVAVAFDPRYHGESAGEPRRYESGKAKSADIRTAIDYMVTRDDVNPEQVFVLGVCQGVNWSIDATIQDERVKGLGLVAGHYLTDDSTAEIVGGAERRTERITQAEAARAKFEATGEVEYMDIVGNPEALLPWQGTKDWYDPWANHSPGFEYRGFWENRMTRMSEAELWTHRADEAVRKLTTATVMIHANYAATSPEITHQVFERIVTEDKQLVWFEDQVQFQFYEDPLIIDRASAAAITFFNKLR